MRVVLRGAGALLLAIVAAMALAVTSTTPQARSATALMVGGTSPTNILPDFVMSWLFNGRFADDTRFNVPYPGQIWPVTGNPGLTAGQSIFVGATILDLAIRLTPGPKTVAGFSLGASVVNEELRRLALDPNAPSKDDLNFLVYGDDTRGNGILTLFRGWYIPILDMFIQQPPETKYDVTVVTGEYDGYADFPDRPENLVSVANAIMGMFTVHITGAFADLSTVPSSNITTTTNIEGGITTTYLVPTEQLPLLAPLRLFGVPEPLVADIEAQLKPMVDAGYSRNDEVATAPVQSQLAPAVDRVNTVTEQPPALKSSALSELSELNVPAPIKPTHTSVGVDKLYQSDISETTKSSSGGKPGDGTGAVADAIERSYARNDRSSSTTSETNTAGTPTTPGSQTSSSTSTSLGSGNTTGASGDD